MYFFDTQLQYPVRVENPDPLFARQLQQAIGGIEGEIRVCLQYFFQAWGARGPTTKYRDVLLNTATEEIGHIEMLATAVALNLENAPLTLQETAVQASPVMNAVMGGGERPRPRYRRHAATPCAIDRACGVSRQFGRRPLRLLAYLC
jgi:Mn-containing catalase